MFSLYITKFTRCNNKVFLRKNIYSWLYINVECNFKEFLAYFLQSLPILTPFTKLPVFILLRDQRAAS